MASWQQRPPPACSPLPDPGDYKGTGLGPLATAATLLRSALWRHCLPRVGMAAAGTQLGRLLVGGLWLLAALLQRGAAAAVAAVDGRRAIAATGENFVCATLDWWPPDKCDYGTCPWARAGLLNLVSSGATPRPPCCLSV
jgi:hypothetical protein